jgi:choline dehydrogenase-like flavoprotein
VREDRQVVVIGSGPAGAMAARELARSGVPVTMLEAGESFEPGLLVRLGGVNVLRRKPYLGEAGGHSISGDPETKCYAKFALGGLSNFWTGAVPRFAPEDFTEGERLHERYRWPISYADLVPYYEMAEHLLDITGDTRDVPQMPAGQPAFRHQLPADWAPVERAARGFGQGFTIMPLADGPPAMLVRRGTAFNSYTAIVQPLLRSPNFQLRAGCHALHLTWSTVKQKIDGVVYYDQQTKQTATIKADAVVVACGALGSAKLLHNSVSSEFPEGLGNSDGLLGHYLHDHPREWWSFEMDSARTQLAPAAYVTRRPYSSSQPLLATSWTLGLTSTADKIRSRFGMKGTAVGVQVFGTTVPTKACAATPSKSNTDEFGLPALDVCMRYSAAEVDNVVQARQHLLDILGEAGWRAKIGEIAPQLFPGTAVHYGGTARMHANSNYGVVDAWNRIHRAPNVLVCDASCFTTGAEKNPTLTVMAIAARAAAHLAQNLRHA